jgi:hypothetical protein
LKGRKFSTEIVGLKSTIEKRNKGLYNAFVNTEEI